MVEVGSSLGGGEAGGLGSGDGGGVSGGLGGVAGKGGDGGSEIFHVGGLTNIVNIIVLNPSKWSVLSSVGDSGF